MRAELYGLAVVKVGGLGVLGPDAGVGGQFSPAAVQPGQVGGVVGVERVQLAGLLQLALGVGQQLVSLRGVGLLVGGIQIGPAQKQIVVVLARRQCQRELE